MAVLTIEVFREQVGRQFRIVPEVGLPVDVELIEAQVLGSTRGAPGGEREPFSLIFRGPLHGHLPQRTYRVENAQMGTHEIFLVPIGPDAQGMRYQAIFN